MTELLIKEGNFNGVIIDIETDDLYPDATIIHCIVCKELSTGKIIKFTDNYNSFINYCKTNNLYFIGHNIISFDLRIIRKLLNYAHPITRTIDTLILSQLSNPIRDGGHSLKSWGIRLGYPKIEPPSNNFDRFSDELVTYCVNDVELTHKLFTYLVNSEEELAKFSESSIKREHLFRYLMDKQEDNGFYFDLPLATLLLAKITDAYIKIENDLKEIFPPTIVKLKTKTKIIPFNPNSRQQIGNHLKNLGWKPTAFTEKGNVIVNEVVLNSITDIPEAKLCKEYLLLQKRSAQIKSWIKFCDPNTSRIYGNVRTLGTVSTRCSHNNPNVAQTPSVHSPFGKECRACWTVEDRDTNVLVGCDANSLELRVLAHYMKDKKYINEILNGDIHSINQKLTGLQTRDQAKTFIYALMYGAGPNKIAKILNKDLIVAKIIRDRFLGAVPSLEKLLTSVDACARKNRKLRALDGRYLHVRSLHSALNVLIQGGGAIICKDWLIQIMKEVYKRKLDVKPIANIHDEIQFEVNKNQAEELGIITQDSLKQLCCPLDSDYKIGTSWSDTH
jgi:DNA polymerase-1